MLTFPNAKINIGLSITNKREDGYHDLETIFYPVHFKDALEIIDAKDDATTIKTSGLSIQGNAEHNLVWKAYLLLQRDYPERVKPLSMYLHKIIPMGAGLGGGSADGAFMLSMLNKHFDLEISEEKLIDYALQLGSDCPFFIRNKPAFATGRGEQLSPIALNLAACTIQLICPEIHVSTAQAFAGIKPKTPSFALQSVATLPISEWRRHVRNDFEPTVFKQHPTLQNIKEQLYEQGAVYAAMSGTGATIYGIFNKGESATVTCNVPFSQHLCDE